MNVTTGRALCPICRSECNTVIDRWERDGVPMETDPFTGCCGATPVYCEEEVAEYYGNAKLIRKSNRNRLDAEAFGPAQEG